VSILRSVTRRILETIAVAIYGLAAHQPDAQSVNPTNAFMPVFTEKELALILPIKWVRCQPYNPIPPSEPDPNNPIENLRRTWAESQQKDLGKFV
jgi:hypothetical protein